MNRKTFLGSSASLIAGSFLPGLSRSAAPGNEEATYKTPPYLKPGDVIGITSPAGYIMLEEIAPAMKLLQSWGYRVQIGATIGKRDFSFGGTDVERATDFQQLLDDTNVKAILCARGGYGS